MNNEIKTRLALIRAGKTPEGYKKGKLGIVPKDWKEINFSELFTSTSEYTDDLEKYPLYSLTIEDGITAKTERYDRSHLVKKENSYKIVRPNDFAYNPMNIRFGAVARHKGEIPVAVSGYYDIFTTVHDSDLSFMEGFLTSDPMITYYNRVSTGSLVEKQRVHFSDFMRFYIPLPPLEERKKIAEILTTQDKVIELCERKIEQLKRMKKYYLQNMFPKNGAEYPEIRFKGFTDPWEQRKVSEITAFHKQGFYTTEPYDDGKKYYLLRGTDLTDNKLVLKDTPKIDATEKDYQAFKTQIGDFLIVRSGTVGTYGIVYDDIPAIFGSYLIDFRFDKSLVTNEFFGYFYQSDLFKNQLRQIIQQSANTNINAENIKSTSIMLPSIPEQKQIGIFFADLDHLITLHQRKCEEEKKKKKALQQLLLTGIIRV